VLEQVPLDLAQFHGNESAAFCTAFGRPYIKAVPMSGSVDPVRYAGDHPAASGFLLDSHAPGERGGTGETFDWDRVPAQIGRPVVLAGGLGPDNVERAVRTVRPYAVDVSSGVETEPGIKSETLIQAFMRGVARGQSR
jgi:phosphoribosylanthranilate isomerase